MSATPWERIVGYNCSCCGGAATFFVDDNEDEPTCCECYAGPKRAKFTRQQAEAIHASCAEWKEFYNEQEENEHDE